MRSASHRAIDAQPGSAFTSATATATPDLGERQASAIATNVLDRSFEAAAINCQAKPLPA